MAQVDYDVPLEEPRNRLTVAFRMILAIPHLILVGVWQYAVQIVSVVHWFIQVFTGRRNSGLVDFSTKWLAYSARVNSYTGLLIDEYPGFIDDQGKTPVSFSLADTEPVNRLTVGLRILWAIPALLIGLAVGIAVAVLTLIAWFVILITGKLAPGWHAFLVKGHRYSLQLTAYTTLLTDQYPKFA